MLFFRLLSLDLEGPLLDDIGFHLRDDSSVARALLVNNIASGVPLSYRRVCHMQKMRRISHVQREKLKKIGMKRRGFKNLLVGCGTVLKALEKEGPLQRSQIMNLAKIPKGTIDRYLWVLKELKCIEKIGRKYVLHSDILIYENKTDRDLALNHSKNIALGLKFIIRPPDSISFEGSPYVEYALKHLKTYPPYRRIYETFESSENARKQLIEEENQFKGNVKARLLSSSLHVLYPDNVAEIVLEDIKEVLRGRQPLFLLNIKVEGEDVKSQGWILAKKEMLKQVKQFVKTEEDSKDNLESCKRMMELENKYNTARQELVKEIEGLILQVENGMPLMGSCTCCPRVVSAPIAEARAREGVDC